MGNTNFRGNLTKIELVTGKSAKRNQIFERLSQALGNSFSKTFVYVLDAKVSFSISMTFETGGSAFAILFYVELMLAH